MNQLNLRETLEMWIVQNRLRLVEIDIQKKLKYISRMKAYLLIYKEHLKPICNIFTAKIFRIIPNGKTLSYSGLS